MPRVPFTIDHLTFEPRGRVGGKNPSYVCRYAGVTITVYFTADLSSKFTIDCGRVHSTFIGKKFETPEEAAVDAISYINNPAWYANRPRD